MGATPSREAGGGRGGAVAGQLRLGRAGSREVSGREPQGAEAEPRTLSIQVYEGGPASPATPNAALAVQSEASEQQQQHSGIGLTGPSLGPEQQPDHQDQGERQELGQEDEERERQQQGSQGAEERQGQQSDEAGAAVAPAQEPAEEARDIESGAPHQEQQQQEQQQVEGRRISHVASLSAWGREGVRILRRVLTTSAHSQGQGRQAAAAARAAARAAAESGAVGGGDAERQGESEDTSGGDETPKAKMQRTKTIDALAMVWKDSISLSPWSPPPPPPSSSSPSSSSSSSGSHSAEPHSPPSFSSLPALSPSANDGTSPTRPHMPSLPWWPGSHTETSKTLGSQAYHAANSLSLPDEMDTQPGEPAGDRTGAPGPKAEASATPATSAVVMAKQLEATGALERRHTLSFTVASLLPCMVSIHVMAYEKDLANPEDPPRVKSKLTGREPSASTLIPPGNDNRLCFDVGPACPLDFSAFFEDDLSRCGQQGSGVFPLVIRLQTIPPQADTLRTEGPQTDGLVGNCPDASSTDMTAAAPAFLPESSGLLPGEPSTLQGADFCRKCPGAAAVMPPNAAHEEDRTSSEGSKGHAEVQFGSWGMAAGDEETRAMPSHKGLRRHRQQVLQTQTTFAALTFTDGAMGVQVLKQVLWVGGRSYVLSEIFGIHPTAALGSSPPRTFPGLGGSSTPLHSSALSMPSPAPSLGATDHDCVVCLSEPRDTVVLPCRHLCLCLGCAKTLGSSPRGSHCPICRRAVDSLLQIKMSGAAK